MRCIMHQLLRLSLHTIENFAKTTQLHCQQKAFITQTSSKDLQKGLANEVAIKDAAWLVCVILCTALPCDARKV